MERGKIGGQDLCDGRSVGGKERENRKGKGDCKLERNICEGGRMPAWREGDAGFALEPSKLSREKKPPEKLFQNTIWLIYIFVRAGSTEISVCSLVLSVR